MIYIVLAISFLLSACGTPLIPNSTPTSTSIPSTLTPTRTPTTTPTITPTPVGGGKGFMLYPFSVPEKYSLPDGSQIQFSGEALYRLDLATQKSSNLITRESFENAIGKKFSSTLYESSPDGTLILIYASTEIAMTGYDTYETYITTLDLKSITPLLTSGAQNIHWVWSPDSGALIGYAVKGTSATIYLVNSDGSDMKIIREPAWVSNPQWSWDSEKIYWLDNGKPMVFDIQTNSTKAIAAVEEPLNTMLYSPSGKYVAYSTMKNEFFVTKADFSEARSISVRVENNCQGKYPPRIVAWSADEKNILIKSTSCLVLFKNLIPKSSYSVALVEDGTRVSFKNIQGELSEYCGWSPDNHLVLLGKLDKKGYLILVKIVENYSSDPIEAIPYNGRCPMWIK